MPNTYHKLQDITGLLPRTLFLRIIGSKATLLCSSLCPYLFLLLTLNEHLLKNSIFCVSINFFCSLFFSFWFLYILFQTSYSFFLQLDEIVLVRKKRCFQLTRVSLNFKYVLNSVERKTFFTVSNNSYHTYNYIIFRYKGKVKRAELDLQINVCCHYHWHF